MLPGRMLCGCTPSSWPPTGEQRYAGAQRAPGARPSAWAASWPLTCCAAARDGIQPCPQDTPATCPADTSATGTITHEPHTRDGIARPPGGREDSWREDWRQDSGQSRPGDDGQGGRQGPGREGQPGQGEG